MARIFTEESLICLYAVRYVAVFQYTTHENLICIGFFSGTIICGIIAFWHGTCAEYDDCLLFWNVTERCFTGSLSTETLLGISFKKIVKHNPTADDVNHAMYAHENDST